MAYVKLTDSSENLAGSTDRLNASSDAFERVSLPDNNVNSVLGTPHQTVANSSTLADDPILRTPPERVTIVRKKHIQKTITKKLTGAEGILFTIALIIFVANAAARGYLNGVLLLIQHTMNLKDSEVIFTDIMFDLGIVIGLFPGVLVRHHMDRPKTLALSTSGLAVGCFMCAGPYFWFSRNHQFFAEPKYLAVDEYEMCGGVTPDEPSIARPPPAKSQGTEFFVIFGSGMMGIGTSLMFVVGLPYVVDAFGGRRTPLVTGVLLTCAAAGVWFGKMCGFLIQRTASGINYSYNNVSRWWLGFLLFGLFSLLFSLLLCTFQDDHPPDKEDEEAQSPESLPDAPADTDGFYYMRMDEERRRSKKCIPFLMKHINIVFLSFGLSLEGAILTGYLFFQPQFMSVVTGQSLSRAEISFASVTMLPIIVGILLCAFYIQCYKMESRKICKLIVIFNIFCLGMCAALFMFKCKEAKIVPDGTSESPCSDSCQCDNELWSPVCGSNKVTYLSPCQAGCSEILNSSKPINNDKLFFQNCTCVKEAAHTASAGACPAECIGEGWHMLLLSLIFFLTGMQFCAGVYVIFRASTGYQRVCALAFFEFMYRLIGNLPALGYFKFTLSRACLHWASNTGDHSIYQYKYDECVLFSANTHHFFFTSLITLLKSFVLLFVTAAFFSTKSETNERTIAERETIRFTRLDLEDDDSVDIEPPPTPL